MAAIGLRGAFAYGAKYLSSLVVVLALGSAIAGGGWYLALLAGASPLAPTVAALTTPQAAAGVALVVLGALVTAAGLVGMAFKLLADAATVGVGEALAGQATTEVVDAAATADDVESESESTAGEATGTSDASTASDDGAAAASDDDVAERPDDRTDVDPDRPTDEATDPTGDYSDGPAPAQVSDRTAEAATADAAESVEEQPITQTAPEADDAAETTRADGTATGGPAPATDAGDRSGPTEGTASTSGQSAPAATGTETNAERTETPRKRSGADAEHTESEEEEGAPAEAETAEGGTRSAEASSDPVVDRAGAAVAEAIRFEEPSDGADDSAADGDGSTAAAPTEQRGAADDETVRDRETRIEPAGRSGEGGGTERDSAEGAPTDDASGAGVVDEHDTKAEEWTPPDPDEFERETGTGGGSGRNGEPGAAAGGGADRATGSGPEAGTSGDGGSTTGDTVGTGSGETIDVGDDASAAEQIEDEDLTLADEGVDTVDVSGDGDPLADRLPGGDG